MYLWNMWGHLIKVWDTAERSSGINDLTEFYAAVICAVMMQ
jgi:hypothetical protein